MPNDYYSTSNPLYVDGLAGVDWDDLSPEQREFMREYDARRSYSRTTSTYSTYPSGPNVHRDWMGNIYRTRDDGSVIDGFDPY
jgi:hypothetical protein